MEEHTEAHAYKPLLSQESLIDEVDSDSDDLTVKKKPVKKASEGSLSPRAAPSPSPRAPNPLDSSNPGDHPRRWCRRGGSPAGPPCSPASPRPPPLAPVPPPGPAPALPPPPADTPQAPYRPDPLTQPPPPPHPPLADFPPLPASNPPPHTLLLPRPHETPPPLRLGAIPDGGYPATSRSRTVRSDPAPNPPYQSPLAAPAPRSPPRASPPAARTPHPDRCGDSARHAPHRATAVAPLDRPSYHTIPPLEPRLPPPRLLAGARPPATHRRLQPPPAWISRPSRCPRRPVPPPPPPTAIPPVGGNPPPGPREPLPPPQHARAPPLPLPSAGLPAIRLPALALGPPPSPPHPRPAALDCSENPRPGGEPPRCPLATTHRVAVTRRPLRPQSARSGRTTNTPPHHRKTKAPPRLTAQHSPPRPGTPAQLPGPPVLRYRYRPPPEQGAIPCRTPSRLPPPRGGRDRPTPRRFTPPARSRPASASPVGRHCRPSAALPRCPPLRCGWGGRAPMPRRPGARVTPSAIPPPSAPPPAPPSPVPRWCPAWPPHRARLPRPLKPVSPGPLPPPRSASPRGRGSRKTLTETPRLAPIRTTTREPLPPPLPRHVKKRRSPPPTTGFPPRCRGRPPAPPWYAPGPAPPPLPPGPDRATPCPSARPRGRPMVTAPRCAERPGSPKRDPAHVSTAPPRAAGGTPLPTRPPPLALPATAAPSDHPLRSAGARPGGSRPRLFWWGPPAGGGVGPVWARRGATGRPAAPRGEDTRAAARG
uniref:Basic proline-rich protein-like n=1 Tax=Knipowitschia caucasica TaxID=637954 RepID=A0AAV2M488_KNICA